MTGFALPDRIVVVGASLAGMRTALGLRRTGFAGRIVLIGDEHRLPYDRPPLSKQVLRGQWQAEQTRLPGAERLDEQGIDVRLGTPAAALDETGRAVVLASGERVPYDAVVLATGTAPRPWPFATPPAGVWNLRRLDDALAIRAAFADGPAVVVIGAGFIGTEVAAAAASEGLAVTVVEPQRDPLAAQLGAAGSSALLALHRDNGVRFVTGRGVVAVRGRDRPEAVELDDGTILPADLVVVGIGVRPNTGWLRGSSPDLTDGVLVTDTGVTAANPAVWAVGDVARWPVAGSAQPRRVEHWTSAVEQAGVVAQNLVRPPSARRPLVPVPYVWTDHYGLKIQRVGLPAAGDETTVVHRSPDGQRFVAVWHRDQRVSCALAFDMPQALPKLRGAVRDGARAAEVTAMFC